MTAARQCDKCGTLFALKIGFVNLDVRIRIDDNGNCECWNGVDLCIICANQIIDYLRPSMDGVDDVLAKIEGKQK